MILLYPIAIKPYLLKYVEFYNKVEPHFTLTDKSKIGSVLISYLQHKTRFNCTGVLVDESYASFKIAVPYRYRFHFGSFINYRDQIRFNEYLRKDFIEKMCDFIWSNQSGEQTNIHKSILIFRERYSISEDDLAFKTMQKWWEREGKKSCA